MSWGSSFNQSGSYGSNDNNNQSGAFSNASFSDSNMGGYSSFEDKPFYDDTPGNTQSQLQAGGYKSPNDYGQKRGMTDDSGSYGFKRQKSDYSSGGGFGGNSWGNVSEITSWDQVSAGKKPYRGSGWGGGSGRPGQFVGGVAASRGRGGNFGGNSRGGGGGSFGGGFRGRGAAGGRGGVAGVSRGGVRGGRGGGNQTKPILTLIEKVSDRFYLIFLL